MALLGYSYTVVSLFSTDAYCARQLSTYCTYTLTEMISNDLIVGLAPALKPLGNYQDVMFHGELFNDDSEFRGSPSLERDAAWDRITPGTPFPSLDWAM